MLYNALSKELIIYSICSIFLIVSIPIKPVIPILLPTFILQSGSDYLHVYASLVGQLAPDQVPGGLDEILEGSGGREKP
jgi:hypothetical protein